MEIVAQIEAFATSAAIGLLIGLERERSEFARAGLRTFALVALAGTACALLSQQMASGWLLAAGALIVGSMMIVAHATGPRVAEDAGTTTTIAALFCYALGAMLWFGYANVAVALALAATALLYFRTELHGISKRLTAKDLTSFLQFAAITLIVLPVLPDRGYGPYGAFNPYQMWLMVVLMSGVSLAGYVALRIAGERRGLPVIGLLGGVASSTATTVMFSHHLRRGSASIDAAALVILTATLVVPVRLSLITGMVATEILPLLAPIFAIGVATGLILPLIAWLRLGKGQQAPHLEMKNPTELPMALAVGVLFALVVWVSSWLNDYAGTPGVYVVAAITGLTDLDAVTLSMLRLFNEGQLGAAQTTNAILLAFCSNLVFKVSAVLVIGGKTLARRVGIGYLTLTAGLAAAWTLLGAG